MKISDLLVPKNEKEIIEKIKKSHAYFFVSKYKDKPITYVLKLNIGIKRKLLFLIYKTNNTVIFYIYLISYVFMLLSFIYMSIVHISLSTIKIPLLIILFLYILILLKYIFNIILTNWEIKQGF